MMDVDAAKVALYARLKITEPGARFCHIPISDQHDLGYFEQLTAETCRVCAITTITELNGVQTGENTALVNRRQHSPTL